MVLGIDDVRRFARQIALPDVGPQGQQRLLASEVALVGEDRAVATARTYLAAAGVAKLRTVAVQPDAAAWLAALRGASLVVRSGFDDDAMLGAAQRLEIPVVAARGRAEAVEVVALRAGRAVTGELDVAPRPSASPPGEGAEAVLAGTLAAAEAIWILARPGEPPRARHLRLPLDGGEPLAQEIPW